MRKTKYFTSFLIWIFAIVGCSPLATEQQLAKKEGLAIYNVHQDLRYALPLLAVAAHAGDPEAQYYMGEIERKRVKAITNEAYAWYEKSALQGEIYAMLRLATADSSFCEKSETCAQRQKTPNEWRGTARDLIEKLVDQGDGQALLQLHFLTGNDYWLIQSANAGFPEGQNLLGVKYLIGGGVFQTAIGDILKAQDLFRAAAQAGYVPAMNNLGSLMGFETDTSELIHWTRIAVNLGDFYATKKYAGWMTDPPSWDAGLLNWVKASGLLYLLKEAEGDNTSSSYALELVARKLSDSEFIVGRAFAEEWKKSHPPLSKFLPKYDYRYLIQDVESEI